MVVYGTDGGSGATANPAAVEIAETVLGVLADAGPGVVDSPAAPALGSVFVPSAPPDFWELGIRPPRIPGIPGVDRLPQVPSALAQFFKGATGSTKGASLAVVGTISIAGGVAIAAGGVVLVGACAVEAPFFAIDCVAVGGLMITFGATSSALGATLLIETYKLGERPRPKAPKPGSNKR